MSSTIVMFMSTYVFTAGPELPFCPFVVTGMGHTSILCIFVCATPNNILTAINIVTPAEKFAIKPATTSAIKIVIKRSRIVPGDNNACISIAMANNAGNI